MDKATFSIVAAVAVIVLGVGATAAHAHEMGPRGGEPGGMHDGSGKEGHQWMEKLNLTAEQKQKIDQIRDEQRNAMKATAEQMRNEQEKMRGMMQGDATDGQLREQHGKVHALRVAVGDAWFESILKIRAVLTPEQRKQMGVFQHDGMGHGGPGMGGPGKK